MCDAPVKGGVMSAPEGRADRKKREVRERVVAAAAALFMEKGSRAVSMDEVARAADVSRRTLFNYFASKDELLYETAAPVLTAASALVEEKLAGNAVGLGDVVALCLHLWKIHGRRLGLIYAVELKDSPRLAKLHACFLGLIRRLVAAAAETEPAFAARADLVGKLLYRTFVPLLLALEGDKDFESRFARGLTALLEGAAGHQERSEERGRMERHHGSARIGFVKECS
jgi:AcrR family transcriptional regulator